MKSFALIAIAAMIYIAVITFLAMFMGFCTRDDKEDEKE